MKALFEVHSINEHADAPSFFWTEVSEDLIRSLEALQALCTNGVTRVYASCSDGVWTSEEREEELRLQGNEMAVSKYGFWFQTYAKHDSGHFETLEESIVKLRADFETGKKLVFYGNEEYLKELYEDAFEASVV